MASEKHISLIKFMMMEKDVSKSHLSHGQSQTISPRDKCSGCGIERALEPIVISILEKKKKQKKNTDTF